MTTETYLTIRCAPLAGYIGITDGSRHVLARLGDPGVPVAAQRRLNSAAAAGKPAAARDLGEVARWLDRHCAVVQLELWAA